jgi:hypothetical protein
MAVAQSRHYFKRSEKSIMNSPEKRLTRAAATDHFFADLEDRIIQRLHESSATTAGREELIRDTGIQDMVLIEELVRLGVTSDGVVAMRLLPLVLVAWAESGPDDNERNTVMKAAEEINIPRDSTPWILLRDWLKHRPMSVSIDAWKRYTTEFMSRISRAAAHQLVDVTEAQMMAVAKASGGILGFGSVSHKERDVINRVIADMRHMLHAPN